MPELSKPAEQALQFVYPAYKKVAADSVEAANQWLYEVNGKFDRFCTFLTVSEKESVRTAARSKYSLDNLQVDYARDIVANKPRPQLFD